MSNWVKIAYINWKRTF